MLGESLPLVNSNWILFQVTFILLHVCINVHSPNGYYNYITHVFVPYNVNTVITTFILLLHYRYCKYQNLLRPLRLNMFFAFSTTSCGLSKSFHHLHTSSLSLDISNVLLV